MLRIAAGPLLAMCSCFSAGQAADVSAIQLGGRHYLLVREAHVAPASATLRNALKVRIDLHMNNEDVTAAVLALGQRYGFPVVAQPQLAVQPLTLHLTNVELGTALGWLSRLS